MKLIIFTPASEKSAIGRMAALVSRELVAQACEVTVVRTEARRLISSEAHDFGARILQWDQDTDVRQLARSADAAIYHVGNSLEYHEGAVRWLGEFPGLVCLHDFFLGHLFHDWAQTRREQASTVLRRWYGENASARFFEFTDPESFIEGRREFMPMTEWICSQAGGVLTHSGWGCGRVMNSCPGPIRVVPLAYDAPASHANSSQEAAAESPALRLLTIGHVNPNKRIASVIRAIGRSALLRSRVSYRLVGAVDPKTKNSLAELAASLGVSLVISGEVGQGELERAIVESDVITCLRWPALEAASASAIEAMLHGKAVIVTNTGFYADIPDSCAIKINQSNEIPEIQSCLEEMLDDRTRIKNLGESARRWATETFIPSNYAMQLIETARAMSRTLPARRAIDGFCLTLSRWTPDGATFVTPDLTNPLRLFES